ncbi:MAG: hypothetical protein AB7F22_34345 [Reyranella sp.]
MFSRRRIALIGNVVTDHHFGIVSVLARLAGETLRPGGLSRPPVGR